MQFPLALWDLSLWLAITAVILLVTSELLSPFYGKSRIILNRRRLRGTALTISILFLLTVFIRITQIIIS